MPGPLPLVLILLLGLLAGGFWLSLRTERRLYRERLRGLAEHVVGATLIQEHEGRMHLDFRLDGHPARLTLTENAGRLQLPSTSLEVGFRTMPPGELRLVEAKEGIPVGEDREIGEAAFDRAWIVQGGLVGRLFARESRAEVVAHLQALRRFAAPCVEAGPEGLRIRVRESLSYDGDVRVLLRTAAMLVSVLGGVSSPDILWVEVRADAPAVCQVCGVTMESQVVRCRRCRTPHHRECWSYNRRCSTFGCGEARFVRG